MAFFVCHVQAQKMMNYLFLYCLFHMFHRYSDDTIEAVEVLDNDEKIDLELIVALIRHIVRNEQVSLTVCLVSGQPSESGKIRVS